MFKTRLLSGIVLVAVALLTIISGGYVLFFTLLGISLIGMQELYKVMKVREDHFNALEIAGYFGAVIYYVLMSLDFEKYGMMGVIISFMMFMFVYVFTYPKFKADQVMPAFFGVVYVAVMLSFIYLTRNLPDGKFLVWLIFYAPGDAIPAAYCVGMLIRQAQNGTNPQPEEISRRWSRRRGQALRFWAQFMQQQLAERLQSMR